MNKISSFALFFATQVSNSYSTISIAATLGILGFLTLGASAFMFIPVVMGLGAGSILVILSDKLLCVAFKSKMSDIRIRILSCLGLLCGGTLIFSMEFPAFIWSSLFSGSIYLLSVYLNSKQAEPAVQR